MVPRDLLDRRSFGIDPAAMSKPKPRSIVGALAAVSVCALTLAGGTASAPLRPGANTASITDPVGDAAADGPDISGVTVSNDDAGNLTFRVSFANRTALGANEGIWVQADTDRNPSTGTALAFGPRGGYEIFLRTGRPNAPRLCDRARADANGAIVLAERGSLECTTGPSAAGFVVNAADLNEASSFDLVAGAYRTEESRFRFDDWAPDCLWRYTVHTASTPPPPTPLPSCLEPPVPPAPNEPPPRDPRVVVRTRTFAAVLRRGRAVVAHAVTLPLGTSSVMIRSTWREPRTRVEIAGITVAGQRVGAVVARTRTSVTARLSEPPDGMLRFRVVGRRLATPERVRTRVTTRYVD